MTRKLSVYSLSFMLVLAMMLGNIASAAHEPATEAESLERDVYLSVARSVTMIVDQMELTIDPEQQAEKPKASDIFEHIADDASYAEAFVIAYLNDLDLPTDVQPEEKISREWFAHLLFQAIETKGDYAFIQIYMLINDEELVSPEYMNSIQKLLIANIASLDRQQNFRPQEQITWGNAMVWINKAKQFVNQAIPIDPTTELPIPDDVELIISNVNEDIQRVTLSWGEKPNPGYGISIDQIRFEQDLAYIYYTLHYPDPERMYPQVIVEPKATTYLSSAYQVKILPMESKGSIEPVESGFMGPVEEDN